MPELPEVETIVRQLRRPLMGSTIRNPKLFKTDVLQGVSSRRLLSTLQNARIADLERRAKHIVMLLDSGDRMVIQLRMSGNLILYDRRLRTSDRDYVVLRAAVGGGRTLVYRDVRRLGKIALLDESAWLAYTERVGPEPLSDYWTWRELRQALSGTTQAVKKAIMDQTRVAGVGNIYANEALFLAGIDPSRPSKKITDAEAQRLHETIRAVLLGAIDRGGTTFRDYRTGTGQPGENQRALQVYGRGGQRCFACETVLVTTHEIDGRATTFCWRCQGSK